MDLWLYYITLTLFSVQVVVSGSSEPLDHNNDDVEISNSHKILAALCPYIINGVFDFDQVDKILSTYRYDKGTRRCYKTFTSDPCGNNMIFEMVDLVYGICQCDEFNHPPWQTLLYHPETNQCYFVFSQGYCRPTHWIVSNPWNRKNAMCVRNPCFNRSTWQGSLWGSDRAKQKPKELVFFNNRCVQLNSHQPECKQDEIVKVYNQKPRCGPLIDNWGRGASGVINTGKICPAGTYKSQTGKCQVGWKWN